MRRNGRKGDYLAADAYTGFTEYASELQRDYWGAMVKRPLLRNLQEIATSLGDPYPVPFYEAQQYEQTGACLGEVAPLYVGLTTVRTNINNAAAQVLDLSPSIGEMSVGCTFLVY